MIRITYRVDVGRDGLWFVFQQVEPGGCWVAVSRGRLTAGEAEADLQRLEAARDGQERAA